MDQQVASNRVKGGQEAESEQNSAREKRPRSMTLLKMQWLAERVRKIEAIRRAIADGSYKVDSRDVARAMLTGKGPDPECDS